MAPDTGDLAPDFTLPDQRSEQVSLSGFRGQTGCPRTTKLASDLILLPTEGVHP